MAVARLIRTLAWIAAAIIVAGILLVVFSANPHNTVVSDIHDAGAWLVTPFKHMFTLDSAKGTIALNWGIAAIVYLAVAHLLASLFTRMPRRGFGRRAVA
jgi:drug/metabolite transporter (DMT)-like permease